MQHASGELSVTVNSSSCYGKQKKRFPLNDLLAIIYLVCFALIGGGAFALMNQNLRGSAHLASAPKTGSGSKRHPEAPEPGEEVMYVDLSRERLEELYQQAS
jgi:hypothetical protein